MNDTEALARQRFMLLNLVRLSGVALALVGLAAIAGKLGLGKEVGAVLFVIGLFEALIAPIFLAKRWKSPPQ